MAKPFCVCLLVCFLATGCADQNQSGGPAALNSTTETSDPAEVLASDETASLTNGDAAPISDSGTAIAAVGNEEKSSDTDGLSIQVLSWKETQNLIGTKKGKIVVLDIWSTYCSPCIREFPGLVKVYNQHPDHVVCMSLNINFDGLAPQPTDELKKEVRDFLNRQKANFENVICSDSDEKFYEQVDIAAIPAVYVFDQTGKLVKRFDNDNNDFGDEGFTYDKHIIPLIETLLKKK